MKTNMAAPLNYEGEMDINGETRTVSFLRVGRVALVYQTLDGEESGAWDQAQGQFVDLDGDFDSQLRSFAHRQTTSRARPVGRAGYGRTMGL